MRGAATGRRGGRARRGGAVLAALLALCGLAALSGAAGAQEEGGDAVAWAGFTTGFENRAPRDRVRAVSTRVPALFYVSELRGLAGRSVIHRWSHEGAVAKEVRFEVEASRWRAVSRHAPGEGGLGTWTVEVVDAESGERLRRDRLEVLPEEPGAEERTGRR